MGINHSKLADARNQRGGRGGWSPKEGTTKIRILPPGSFYFTRPEDLSNLAVAYKMHFFKQEGSQTEVTRCLQDLGQKCPACKMWWKYRKSETDPGMAEIAGEIGPRDQYLFNIIDFTNLSAGIQIWTANWTCWDKVMEVAANPDWGDVVSPTNGINFTVTKTPPDRGRKGKWPSYSVMPDPNRMDISRILEGIEDWQSTLDAIQESITEAKSTEAINTILADMGFPVVGAAPSAVRAAPAPTVAPQPAAPSPQAPEADTEEEEGLPWEDAPTPPHPTPVPAASTTTAGRVDAKGKPIPAGAPDCFGDYNTQIHPCSTCKVQSECQMRYLGLD